MASRYLIQVIHKDTKEVVQWEPGLAVEKNFVDELCQRVAAKGVGVVRTSDQVVRKVRAALEELLFDLKMRV